LLQHSNEVSEFRRLRENILRETSRIVEEEQQSSDLVGLFRKKTYFSRSEGVVWVNSPFFETFTISQDMGSKELKLLRYDKSLTARTVLTHPLLQHKTFTLFKYHNKTVLENNRTSEKNPHKELSLLLFHDSKEIPRKMEQFLEQVGRNRTDLGKPLLEANELGVKQVLYFDRRFVCVFREILEPGTREPGQFVDVFDLESQKIVFQTVSSPSQIITHVQVFKIAKTNEFQLFVGTVNKAHEGHSRAEWKIYRVIKKRGPHQEYDFVLFNSFKFQLDMVSELTYLLYNWDNPNNQKNFYRVRVDRTAEITRSQPMDLVSVLYQEPLVPGP
jgi:hypothetical protein